MEYAKLYIYCFVLGVLLIFGVLAAIKSIVEPTFLLKKENPYRLLLKDDSKKEAFFQARISPADIISSLQMKQCQKNWGIFWLIYAICLLAIAGNFILFLFKQFV
jgi:hypothetical protein